MSFLTTWEGKRISRQEGRSRKRETFTAMPVRMPCHNGTTTSFCEVSRVLRTDGYDTSLGLHVWASPCEECGNVVAAQTSAPTTKPSATPVASVRFGTMAIAPRLLATQPSARRCAGTRIFFMWLPLLEGPMQLWGLLGGETSKNCATHCQHQGAAHRESRGQH